MILEVFLYLLNHFVLQVLKNKNYIDFEKIKNEIEVSKRLFQKYNWPTIDVTRKSVEETAASILKIHDIFNHNE